MSVRGDGQHPAVAAEVGEGVLDVGGVDGADGAEVLGDHEVGVEAGERARVEVVEVLARAPSRADTAASIWARLEALGERARRHDPPRARASGGWSHSKVTPTTSLAGAEREEDLGGGGQQRDDAHGATLTRQARQPRVASCGSRKVRTPQSRVLVNGQRGKPQGKCHRNDTAFGARVGGNGEKVR